MFVWRHFLYGAHKRIIFVIFYFIISVKAKNLSQVAKKLCDYNDDKAFKGRNFLLKDEPRSGWPSAIDEYDIKDLNELYPHVTVREFKEKLKIPKSTFHGQLKSLELAKKASYLRTT